MDKLRSIMADIVTSLSDIEKQGLTKESSDKQVQRLTKRVNHELVLVRDRHAANTLITTMLFEVNQFKMCLAYHYKGKLYTTRRNVPNHDNTDVLHTLGMTSDQWDKLPKFSVWISTGSIFSPVP